MHENVFGQCNWVSGNVAEGFSLCPTYASQLQTHAPELPPESILATANCRQYEGSRIAEHSSVSSCFLHSTEASSDNLVPPNASLRHYSRCQSLLLRSAVIVARRMFQ
jgi:hypothetical protein